MSSTNQKSNDEDETVGNEVTGLKKENAELKIQVSKLNDRVEKLENEVTELKGTIRAMELKARENFVRRQKKLLNYEIMNSYIMKQYGYYRKRTMYPMPCQQASKR